MFPYADYEFYLDNMDGKLEEITFKKEVLEASYYLRSVTFGKSDKSDLEDLKYAVCAIAEMYAKEKEKHKTTKKSEDTDGYSVVYATELKDGEVLEDLLSKKASQIARKYLATTGLLSRKVQRIRC